MKGRPRREQYAPVYCLDGAAASWEDYDRDADNYGDFDGWEFWLLPDEAWKLTPEQAAQLGPIRGNQILLQVGYADKLRGWKLIK